jgi:hypothetical protein
VTSSIHVQELFRNIRTNYNVEMTGLSVNRVASSPQTISLEGWKKVSQDLEILQYSLEVTQLSMALHRLYGSVAATLRSCNHHIPDLVTAIARLKNRRITVMKHIYQEEYLAQFTSQVPSIPPIVTKTNCNKLY